MDLPEVDMLLSIVCHKCGISPMTYMRTRTRAEFESDVRGWVGSFIYPVNQIAKAFVGDEGSSRQIESSDQPRFQSGGSGDVLNDQRARERSASRMYSWKRSVSGRKYNLVNLDVADQAKYRQAVHKMKKNFSEQ